MLLLVVCAPCLAVIFFCFISGRCRRSRLDWVRNTVVSCTWGIGRSWVGRVSLSSPFPFCSPCTFLVIWLLVPSCHHSLFACQCSFLPVGFLSKFNVQVPFRFATRWISLATPIPPLPYRIPHNIPLHTNSQSVVLSYTCRIFCVALPYLFSFMRPSYHDLLRFLLP